MTATYPPTIREAVGPYFPATLQGSFDSGASAGDLWTRDVDATVAVRTFEAPFNGYVAWISVDCQGGALATCQFAIQIETVADADVWLPGAVSAGSKIFLPSQIPFLAGNSIAVEIDVIGTFRDCCVTLGLVFDAGNN